MSSNYDNFNTRLETKLPPLSAPQNPGPPWPPLASSESMAQPVSFSCDAICAARMDILPGRTVAWPVIIWHSCWKSYIYILYIIYICIIYNINNIIYVYYIYYIYYIVYILYILYINILYTMYIYIWREREMFLTLLVFNSYVELPEGSGMNQPEFG